MPSTSSSRMIVYSLPSILTSVPLYLPIRTRSPFFTSSAIRLPSSVMRPGPTAITSPSWGFSLAVSGMMIPPRFVSCSSIRRTRTRSARGRTFMLLPPPSRRVALPHAPRVTAGSKTWMGFRAGRGSGRRVASAPPTRGKLAHELTGRKSCGRTIRTWLDWQVFRGPQEAASCRNGTGYLAEVSGSRASARLGSRVFEDREARAAVEVAGAHFADHRHALPALGRARAREHHDRVAALQQRKHVAGPEREHVVTDASGHLHAATFPLLGVLADVVHAHRRIHARPEHERRDQHQDARTDTDYDPTIADDALADHHPPRLLEHR